MTESNCLAMEELLFRQKGRLASLQGPHFHSIGSAGGKGLGIRTKGQGRHLIVDLDSSNLEASGRIPYFYFSARAFSGSFIREITCRCQLFSVAAYDN